MALANPSFLVDTTFTNKNIVAAASVYQFTAAANGKIQFLVKLTNAAGGGDYTVYLTHQWLGAGAATVMLPKTTAAVAAGETNVEFVTLELGGIRATDVVNVMVQGLAGDGAVNGNIRITGDNPSVFDPAADTVANVTNLATYTGNTPQTGDAFARIGAAGAGLTALGDARIANLDTTVSSRSTVAQVNVVLARIGAFTGGGLNTILGFLRAMASKAAALTPSDLGGTFTNVTDSLEAIRDKIGSGTITVTGPVVTTDGDVVTYRGDTYLNEDGRALDWESDDWPDLTGGSVKVIIAKVAEFTGSVVTPIGTVKVRLELTATQSRSIAAGRHNFQVVATQSDGDVATLVAAAWVSRARAEV